MNKISTCTKTAPAGGLRDIATTAARQNAEDVAFSKEHFFGNISPDQILKISVLLHYIEGWKREIINDHRGGNGTESGNNDEDDDDADIYDSSMVEYVCHEKVTSLPS